MIAFLYRFIAMTIVIVSFAGGWLWMDYDRFLQRPVTVNNQNVVIERGQSVRTIAQQLLQQKIINNSDYFYLYARLSGNASKIQAGEYLLNGALTPEQLLQIFMSGREKQYSFTIVEGWSVAQLLQNIAAVSQLRHLITDVELENLLPQLELGDSHPEGMFMPDTYFFPRDYSDKELLQRAYKAMQDYLQEQWPQRDPNLPLQSAYEALILASIVEKESGKASERKQIAGVFTRRLQKNMRLQTDPTVIYGMGSRYDGNIRRSDLRTDTPYNTYTRMGLPPTPIALAGRDAILAALHPQPGKSLYFVSKGDGSHYFSDTLEQHNSAVRRYQLSNR